MKQYLVVFFLFLGISACFSQINRQWVATYNGQGDFNDRFTCVTSDASGNIYLGGSTTNKDLDRDYLIVKLDPNGTVLWSTQYSGLGTSTDEVLAITTDASGNVYVTGFAKGLNTSQDFLTIKLDSNGDTLWTKSYDYISEYDQANSIAVDGSGNVYVTGLSDQDGSFITNDDYATIKYDANGTEIWVVRFNNSIGNAIDQSEKILLDGSGNIYVTGRSNNGSDDDFVTIKYNNSGAQQWIKYDDRGGRDRATDMAIDPSGNLYITGRSDNGTNDDFWTIKYSASGTQLWQKAYDYVDNDFATAIAIDASGNVFVTGYSDSDATPTTDNDYQTVAYNSSGTQIWQKRFAGAALNEDVPNGISVLGSSVYVTGQSDADPSTLVLDDIVTLSYNASNGTQNWISTYAGSPNYDDTGIGILANASGCLVAGFSEDANGQRNAVSIQYDLTGSQQWLQSFTGVGDNNENIRSLAVDGSGNVFASGYSVMKGQNRNFTLVKFNNAGTFDCVYTLDGSSVGSEDDAQSVVLDNAGNAIVAGFTKNKGTSNDLQWLSLNSLCDTTWTKIQDGPGNGSDKIYDMVADGSGNFYFTGRVDADLSASTNDNCYTVKIDGSGNILWSKFYDGGISLEDRGVVIRVAPSGNVYVTGRSWNGTNYDIFILKYNAAGNQQWVHTYHGGFGNDEPADMVLDANENILITGISEEATDSIYNYVTLKYTSGGNQQWAKKYNSGNGNDDQSSSIAVDGNNEILVTGKSDTDPGIQVNYDIVTIKYSSSGAVIWVNAYAGNNGLDDTGDDIAINSLNQVYVTGHINTNTTQLPVYDVVSYILNSDGSSAWADVYNSPSDSSDVPNLILLNGNDFYVAGSTIEGNQMRNMLVIKYSGIVTSKDETAVNNSFRIYPNPCSDKITILTESVFGKMELSNCLGQIVFIDDVSLGKSVITLPKLPQGVYFYRIISESDEVLTGKLMINSTF